MEGNSHGDLLKGEAVALWFNGDIKYGEALLLLKVVEEALLERCFEESSSSLSWSWMVLGSDGGSECNKAPSLGRCKGLGSTNMIAPFKLNCV